MSSKWAKTLYKLEKYARSESETGEESIRPEMKMAANLCLTAATTLENGMLQIPTFIPPVDLSSIVVPPSLNTTLHNGIGTVTTNDRIQGF